MVNLLVLKNTFDNCTKYVIMSSLTGGTNMSITYEVTVSKESTEWRLNGKLHREDGPARIWADGSKSWWIHGNQHREDGPAYEGADGSTWWYTHGVSVTEQEVMKPIQELTIAQLEERLGYRIKVVK